MAVAIRVIRRITPPFPRKYQAYRAYYAHYGGPPFGGSRGTLAYSMWRRPSEWTQRPQVRCQEVISSCHSMSETATVTRGRIASLLGLRGGFPVRLYEALVITPTLLLIGTAFLLAGVEFLGTTDRILGALFWTAMIALVELLPVPAWRSLQVGTGFPLFTAVAFIYPPEVAGVIAFLGSSDPRELRGQVRPLRALFNRSQLALSLFAASAVFHSLGADVEDWSASLAVAAPAAVLVFNLINTLLVSVAAGLTYGVPVLSVMRKMKIGNPLEFLISYLGLGLLGVLLARLYLAVGWWAVAAFVMPLLLARQMFFRTRALEEATRELQDREVVLRALSNRMAEERQDERTQIAGYLHDDLAQVLYRMALHLDISDKLLEQQNTAQTREELAALRSSRDRAMELVRALIRDLHRSPIGRHGLTEAITSYAHEVERDSRIRIETRLQQLDMPAPIQLLCYHVAREAIMNAIKHAEASVITVSLEATVDGARLTVSDNGRGFDPEQDSPEGHFGLTMMRERAQVSGGDFRIDSAPGKGSTVTADFPTSWMVESNGQTQERERAEVPSESAQA
jgi:signal transduction histidine kinase